MKIELSKECKGTRGCLMGCQCQDQDQQGTIIVSSCEVFVDMYGSLLLKDEDDEMVSDVQTK